MKTKRIMMSGGGIEGLMVRRSFYKIGVNRSVVWLPVVFEI